MDNLYIYIYLINNLTKLYFIKKILTLIIAIALCQTMAFAQKANNENKNYVSFGVGFWPSSFKIYTQDMHDAGSDGYYYGPVFSLTYGRTFNSFLAAEGNIFIAPMGRTNIPWQFKYKYQVLRYGATAGVIVTPLGKWFRYIKMGAVFGVSREETTRISANDNAITRENISKTCFAINYPLRIYALDSHRFAAFAEANIQTQFNGGNYYRRTVNYAVNMTYKF